METLSMFQYLFFIYRYAHCFANGCPVRVVAVIGEEFGYTGDNNFDKHDPKCHENSKLSEDIRNCKCDLHDYAKEGNHVIELTPLQIYSTVSSRPE